MRLALGTLGIAVLIAAAVGIYFSLAPANRPAGAERSPEGFPIRLHSEPKTLPNIAFKDGSGRKVTLADFKGKIVLLNVWATWCPPCRKEMPSLDRLQQRLGGPGFEVIALSIDQGDSALFLVQEFFLEIGVKHLRTYIDSAGQATGRLEVVGLPTTLLIDSTGREIGRLIGPAEWDSPEAVAMMRRYLGAPAKS